MEKILKREDGSRIKIQMNFNAHSFTSITKKLRVDIYICQPKKRTFLNVIDTDDWDYRKLSTEERIEYRKNICLKYVTTEELEEMKKEYINSLLKDSTFHFGN